MSGPSVVRTLLIGLVGVWALLTSSIPASPRAEPPSGHAHRPALSILGRRAPVPAPRRPPPAGWTRAWRAAYRKSCRLQRQQHRYRAELRRLRHPPHATARQILRAQRDRDRLRRKLRNIETELQRTRIRLLRLRRQLLQRNWRPGEIRALEQAVRRKTRVCRRPR